MNKEQYKTYLRQRLNEEDSDDAQIASHPHGVLTGLLARHLGLDASDVFETTSALTADSLWEDVDGAMAAVIYKHGNRLFDKLSNNRKSPYYTPHPDDSKKAQKARDRFVADLTDHVNLNVSDGKHTEFKGTPAYDGL